MTMNVLFADSVAGILPAVRGRDALATEGRFLGHGLKGPKRRFAFREVRQRH